MCPKNRLQILNYPSILLASTVSVNVSFHSLYDQLQSFGDLSPKKYRLGQRKRTFSIPLFCSRYRYCRVIVKKRSNEKSKLPIDIGMYTFAFAKEVDGQAALVSAYAEMGSTGI